MSGDQQNRGLIPVVKKAVIYNILFVFYILSPSFIAFCLTIFVVCLLTFEDAAQTIIGIVNDIQAEHKDTFFERINKYCAKFNEMGLLMRNFDII